MRPGGLNRIDDGVADGGFASAGLTDDADDLALSAEKEILTAHPVAEGTRSASSLLQNKDMVTSA